MGLGIGVGEIAALGTLALGISATMFTMTKRYGKIEEQLAEARRELGELKEAVSEAKGVAYGARGDVARLRSYLRGSGLVKD